MRLFHESGLAITISVDLRVELIHEAGLVLTCLVLVFLHCVYLILLGLGMGNGFGDVLGESFGQTAILVGTVLNVALAAATVDLSARIFRTCSAGMLVAGRVVEVAVPVNRAVLVGAVAGQVMGIDLAVIVAISGVVGSVRAVAGQVVSIDLAVVVAVNRVASLQVTVAGVAVGVVGLVREALACNKTSSDASSATNVLGDTFELIVALLTSSKSSTLGLELLHGHGRQSSGVMVGRLVMMNLMDGDGGVDYVGLDGLLLDYGLDGLVDVVVDVLSANSGGNTLAVGGVIDAPLVSKASLVVDKSPLGSVCITVVELAVLNSTKLSSVSLRENITVLDRLDSAVVVVLVDLLVDSGVNFLMYVRLHDLVLDRGGDCLVDSGIMVTGLAHEVGDSCLGLVHFDWSGSEVVVGRVGLWKCVN